MSLTMVVDEVGKRYSVFYVVGCVASAFSGILAYGVSTSVLKTEALDIPAATNSLISYRS
jgi:hypothetical protein